MALHPDVASFAALLRQIEAALRLNDHASWAHEVAACAATVERSDAYGVHRFLSLFGGMGSLNDIVILGPEIPAPGTAERLEVLVAQAHAAARRLARDA